MSQRARLILLALVTLIATVVLASGQTSSPRSPANCASGRYQFTDDVAKKIFDTETGKLYIWFPRDETTNTDPYVLALDPVSGAAVQMEIKWTKKAAR